MWYAPTICGVYTARNYYMSYSQGFKNRVKNAFVGGKYKTIGELCDAFGVNRKETVYKWIKDGNWRGLQQSVDETRLKCTQQKIRRKASEVEQACLDMWFGLEASIGAWLKIGNLSPESIEKLTKAAERVHKGLRLAIGLPESVSQEVITGKPVEELSEEELQRELERVTEHISTTVAQRATPTANAPPTVEAGTLKAASG